MFAVTLAPGAWTPLVAFAIAAASDYVDGPLARRAGGPTRYGVLLDAGADVAFVVTALAAGAAQGRIARAVPVAVVCAAAPYLVATARRTRVTGAPSPAYSAVGHAAGVCNYALVGVLAGSVALPAPWWTAVLAASSGIVLALNVTAVLMRLRAASRPRRSEASNPGR